MKKMTSIYYLIISYCKHRFFDILIIIIIYTHIIII